MFRCTSPTSRHLTSLQIFTDASKGAVVKLPNSVLLRWVAIANLVLIVLMAGQIGIGELRSQFEVDMAPGIAAPTDDVVAQIGQCSSNTPFIILLVVIFACFTAWGATTAVIMFTRVEPAR